MASQTNWHRLTWKLDVLHLISGESLTPPKYHSLLFNAPYVSVHYELFGH